MESMGVLKDGTPFRRFAPPLPLDDRWKAPHVPADMLATRDRWVNLRASLMQAGQLDDAVRRLITFWHEHGLIPRAVDQDGGDHTTLLLTAGIDTALAASSKTNFDVIRAMVPQSTRRNAAELLARPIRQNNDPTPVEVGALHAMVCPGATAPINKEGVRQDRFAGAREGAFRAKPIYVMGTDWVMKEGAPPRQILTELLRIIESNRAARQRGVPAVIRAAWLIYAFGVVHPFYDGNGKVGRMLGTMVLVRGGRLPFIMPPSVHRAFFDTMADARNGRPEMLIRLVAECQVALMESALAALT